MELAAVVLRELAAVAHRELAAVAYRELTAIVFEGLFVLVPRVLGINTNKIAHFSARNTMVVNY